MATSAGDRAERVPTHHDYRRSRDASGQRDRSVNDLAARLVRRPWQSALILALPVSLVLSIWGFSSAVADIRSG